MSARGQDEPLVAMVVMRPASGRPMPGGPITAETLPAAQPAPGDADAVSRALREAGFEVGPLVGIAMSIAGPRAAFERYFATRILPAEDGGWLAGGRRELPLPAALVDRVHAVTFEEPAEPVGGDAVAP